MKHATLKYSLMKSHNAVEGKKLNDLVNFSKEKRFSKLSYKWLCKRQLA